MAAVVDRKSECPHRRARVAAVRSRHQSLAHGSSHRWRVVCAARRAERKSAFHEDCVGDNEAMSSEEPIGSSPRLVVITGLPGSGKSTLASKLAPMLTAVRMCPDDWMTPSGVDLWDDAARARIEAFQLELTLDLLRGGRNVIIEWGVWTRSERDAIRRAARAVGAAVELRYTTAPVDELWRRIVQRDLEGNWGSRPIEREQLEEWTRLFEPPTDDEYLTYRSPG